MMYCVTVHVQLMDIIKVSLTVHLLGYEFWCNVQIDYICVHLHVLRLGSKLKTCTVTVVQLLSLMSLVFFDVVLSFFFDSLLFHCHCITYRFIKIYLLTGRFWTFMAYCVVICNWIVAQYLKDGGNRCKFLFLHSRVMSIILILLHSTRPVKCCLLYHFQLLTSA